MNGRTDGHWHDPIDSTNCQLSHKSNYQTGQNDHCQFFYNYGMNYPSTHHNMHSGCKCDYCKSLKQPSGYAPGYGVGYESGPHYQPVYQGYDQYPVQHYQMASAHNSGSINHSNTLYPYQPPYSNYSMAKSSEHSGSCPPNGYFVESSNHTSNNSNSNELANKSHLNTTNSSGEKLSVARVNSHNSNENVYNNYINAGAKGYYSDSDSDAANQMSKKMQQDGRFKFHRKRPRTIFTPYQLIYLEAEFKKNPYITGSRKQELSKKSDLSGYQISVWFQNRRAKFKKEERSKDF